MFIARKASPYLTLIRKRNIALFSSQTNVIEDMFRRGLIANTTSPELEKRTEKPTAIYCGVDPTAKSLHLGNLVTLMGLLHFHIRGHQTIALVGGATGSIGDPSGRQSERVPLAQETLSINIAGINKQIHRFFSHGAEYASRRGFNQNNVIPKVLNNYEWFSKMSALDFLSDIGRYARVNSMLAKESVKSRISSVQGISFTEFSYQLLQAYDFYYLHRYHDCRIQLGGSDQWGNITAGIDMISRKRSTEENQTEAYGITIPLLLTSSGEKFGKSAGNAVWLDESMTSVFDFYQFLMKTTDDDVEKYLEMFTLLKREQVQEILVEHKKSPELRIAQNTLANETTELVHGLKGLQKAQTATQVLFGQDVSSLTGERIIEAFKDDSHRFTQIERSKLVGMGLDHVATMAQATKSKSDAQKRIKSGGFYLNNARVNNHKQTLEDVDLIDGKICILRVGKASYYLVQAV